ncbi:MAG TPA: outer membrane beta-barrel protein [Candidatus Aquicultoraceae bacterium]|nr:outer membrane beta-barrel protein [Candidatus Aquicultoraceae bacterium]
MRMFFHSLPRLGLLVGVLAAVTWPAAARAQQAFASWELNVHAGTLIPDDDLLGEDEDAEFLLGGRIARDVGSGFAIGGNFDWIPATDVEFPSAFETDVNTFLYSGDVSYTFPTGASPLRVFVLVGAGAGTVSYDDQPPGLNDDSTTGFLLPFGGGVKWLGERFGFRAEVRDNLLFLDAEDVPFLTGNDTESLNNVELSGGVSFLF